MKYFNFVSLCFLILFAGCGQEKGQSYRWGVHDLNRPQPPVVVPGDKPGQPPSNAVVLFDGDDTEMLQMHDGSPVKWKMENGYLEAVPKSGSLMTRHNFGDCQLHIEWCNPSDEGKGQFHGNSGVFLMNQYEVQILDSYNNTTYPDGQAAAIYGQYPPMFNAMKPTGQWQVYDIVFRRPRFNDRGEVVEPARVTVFHNGIVVQESAELAGATANKQRAKYTPHPDAMPIMLQDHHNPVRFRNIWVVQLPERQRYE